MIQFNLLPDVKLEYIHAQQLKRSVLTICVIAAGTMLTVLVLLLLVVDVFQKQHLRGVDGDIKTSQGKLQSITDLGKVVTIQNQLNSLTALHDQKYVVSRLFGYLKQIVPDKITIDSLNVDFDNHTMVFTGSADNLVTVNKFIDTLKFTTITNVDDKQSGSINAFSGVVLASFARNDKDSSYAVNVNFASELFDSAYNAKMTVPKIVTTRSTTEKPSDLFKKQTSSGTNQSSQ